MALLILVLLIAVIVLGSRLSALRERTLRLEELHATTKEHVNSLAGRVTRLERSRDTVAGSAPAPVQKVQATVPPEVPVADLRLVLAAASPVVAPAPAPTMEIPPAAPATAERADSWELVVGTSWLNKIGVLVFVVGVALLVGYSFTLIGQAGRVALGYLVSGALLGTGVWMQRKPAFRNYAHGLVAGGWAGVYFTTFAMREVPAAQIIESDLLAAILLTTVAAGMIAHSLRYRSQVVTLLAFVVAYATLALSPLSGFSLAASVPLAVTVLVVSQRLGWSGVSALGVAASYGSFVLRAEVWHDGGAAVATSLPYAVLAIYWVTFEVADIVGLRMRAAVRNPPEGESPSSMMALNAVGFLAALVMTVRVDDARLFSMVLFSAAVAYTTSAIARRWLVPAPTHPRPTTTFDSAHAATAVSALLFAAAIGLRFDGNRASLARLLEAELLITAGFSLRDIWLRRMGSAAFALAAVHALLVVAGSGPGAPIFDWTWMFGPSSLVLVLIAAAGYAHREALHRHACPHDRLEPGVAWIATALLATTCAVELAPAYQGLAGLMLAFALLEVGWHRGVDYLRQSYAIGGLASVAAAMAFVLPVTADGRLGTWGSAPGDLEAWAVLPISAIICGVASWRLATRSPLVNVPERSIAVALAGGVAILLTVVFQWRVLPSSAVAPAWSATAVALVAFGSWRSLEVLRWQGYLVAAASLWRVMTLLAHGLPDTPPAVVSVALAIALVYTASVVGRRALPAVALSLAATVSLATFLWRLLPDLWVAPAWAATAVVFVAFGKASEWRWHSQGLLAIAAFGMAGQLFVAHAATAVDESLVVIALLYGCGLAIRRLTGPEVTADAPAAAERSGAAAVLCAATLLLAGLILQEARPAFVTLFMGAQGLALMLTGLAARERVLRLSGLALLLACIVKLFLHDLREMEALARILSFVALGVFLLAISWIYTRYRDQIRRLL